jgi:hypothetical protein
MQYNGKKWTNPIFTGVIGWKEGYPNWFTNFVGNPQLTKDSDNDGWTDLIEQRLGTNPNNPDSDGDGCIDSEDKNPLAAPRSFNEEEQILYATFKAVFQNGYGDQGSGSPYLIELHPGVEPIEFEGSNWVIISKKYGTESPLSKLFMRGLGYVSFTNPFFYEYDFTSKWVKKHQNETEKFEMRPIISWNKDRTEAIVQLSVVWDGLSGRGFEIHLKKIHGYWIVTTIDDTWES